MPLFTTLLTRGAAGYSPQHKDGPLQVLDLPWGRAGAQGRANMQLVRWEWEEAGSPWTSAASPLPPACLQAPETP